MEKGIRVSYQIKRKRERKRVVTTKRIKTPFPLKKLEIMPSSSSSISFSIDIEG
jgi:hypothetical protein